MVETDAAERSSTTAALSLCCGALPRSDVSSLWYLNVQFQDRCSTVHAGKLSGETINPTIRSRCESAGNSKRMSRGGRRSGRQ